MKELLFKHIRDKLDTSEFANSAKFETADDFDLNKKLIDRANTFYIVDADMDRDAMNNIFRLAKKDLGEVSIIMWDNHQVKRCYVTA